LLPSDQIRLGRCGGLPHSRCILCGLLLAVRHAVSDCIKQIAHLFVHGP
jgi:hypothetical protein